MFDIRTNCQRAIILVKGDFGGYCAVIDHTRDLFAEVLP
jgi:hypothetical protein